MYSNRMLPKYAKIRGIENTLNIKLFTAKTLVALEEIINQVLNKVHGSFLQTAPIPLLPSATHWKCEARIPPERTEKIAFETLMI